MPHNRVGKINTDVYTKDNKTYIKYHKTNVVIFDQNTIQLNSGGWLTATTKKRMNQASMQYSLGFGVYQENFYWYVTYKGEVFPFVDNMILER